jgi:alanine-glyoxylate transaminase/serine-glyoxylate transaminase/serine-pyruvate transaminase
VSARFETFLFDHFSRKRMLEKKTPPPYYFDVKRLADYWGCTEENRTYHYTFSSNMLVAVREALAQVCEEGLLAMWERHKNNARLFWKKLDEIGMECFVEKIENRFNGVTGVKIPKGIDQLEFLHFLKTKYAIDITPGHGPTLGKAMRVGLMGQNSRPEVVEYLIEALKDGLKHFGHTL